MIEIEAIVDDLYAGILDADAWDRALLTVADAVRASAAFLFAFSHSSGEVLRDENHRGDPRALEDYRKHWVYRDCRVAPAFKVPVGQPVTEAALVPRRDWLHSAILNEFLIPHDVPHFMPVILHRTAERFVVLSLQGTNKRGAFDGQDISHVQRIVPHVARAIEIKDRLEAARLRSHQLATCLDQRLPFGLLVLDRDLRILESNSQADRLLRANHGIRTDRLGHLQLPEPAARELHLLSKTGLRYGSLGDGVLRVPRGPQHRPLSLLIAPLPGNDVSWMLPTPHWLVLIFDPEQAVRVDTELLRVDLGVTRREADVAALLATGFELRAAAANLGISVHTARVHLKSIFGKTGLFSQAELVRRILSGPAAFSVHRR